MEDIEGYLRSASVVVRGKRKAVDSDVISVVETNELLRGKEGESTGLFAVNGGFAGGDATAVVSKVLRKHLLRQEGYEGSSTEGLGDALSAALLNTQQDIYEQWRVRGRLHGVHSCVLLLRDGKVLAANAGDGGAVICRADGVVGLLTEKKARLDVVEDVSVSSYGLDWEDEFIILGCHSFWAVMDPTRAVLMARTALRKYRDVKYAVQKLAVAAQMLNAPGNIAISLVLLNAPCAYGVQDEDCGGVGELSEKMNVSGLTSTLSETGSESSFMTTSSNDSKSRKSLFRRRAVVPKAPTVFVKRDRALVCSSRQTPSTSFEFLPSS
mmetsp:Transcript_6877/g.18418  ORF Transcript_6877/g.18418 Transcript_6877/m.18418 type:complete len:325 (+) Transcript_6877:90-1064(+)|eukprot:CAMPEP_0185841714 /NCGR_PEP_ID=MMETSP1353-20130828/18038_1 /TAXON_ID=1077150 /ORGANISM="Erythrolobus australicus, Strain CCMP3124" /LENGTH=324 /DNA_ID=CAMNT_0028541201 /DNA_START=409 /DNA_END=1383 /DNA_ORIENTATION=-